MKARVATIYNSNTWSNVLNVIKDTLSKNQLETNISETNTILCIDEPLGKFEEISTFLNSESESCLLLVFESLETVISRSLKLNENVNDAVIQFSNDLKQLYKYKTKYKNRLIILDAKETQNNASMSLKELLTLDHLQVNQPPSVDIHDIFSVYYVASLDNLKSMSSKFSIITNNTYLSQSDELICIIERVSEEFFSNKESTEQELTQLVEANNELKLDKQLLLEQLKQVQTELEYYYKKYTLINNDVKVFKIKNEQLETDIRKKRRQLRNTDVKLNELTLQNDKAYLACKNELSNVVELNELLSQKELRLTKQLKSQEAQLIESRSSRRQTSKLNDRLKYNLILAEHKALLLSAERYSSNEKLRLLNTSPFLKVINKLIGRTSKLSDTKLIERLENLWLIENSKLFDENWYVNKYSDVGESKLSPAEHYLDIGENASYFPSMEFDPIWYSSRYPDIQSADFSPLLHYIRFGFAEGRLPKSS
ncbi:hypothetical protein [Paraglaciecola chathamensis]|uniref:hypothetical protein n=1 Tax=Paraglaciecola chathamensis TaxID=368405 RepID=UPI0026FC8123|nr:hypothetical protein [Paraglaciecola chathamensis]MDO6559652.1 hypothetical protein [Paraglaciecola chathamensis]